MSLVLYTAPMSTGTITDLVVEELGLPVDKKIVDLKNKSADFLAVNPNGKVPAIVHDGNPIWESAAITIYLGETFGTAKGLWPAPGPKRGQAMQWVVWNQVSVGDAVYRIGRNTGEWTPKDHQNANAAAAAAKELGELLGLLDKHLTDKQFLVGEYTLADAHVNCFFDWLRHMKVDFSKFDHINAWSKRCSERPAYKKVNAH